MKLLKKQLPSPRVRRSAPYDFLSSSIFVRNTLLPAAYSAGVVGGGGGVAGGCGGVLWRLRWGVAVAVFGQVGAP